MYKITATNPVPEEVIEYYYYIHYEDIAVWPMEPVLWISMHIRRPMQAGLRRKLFKPAHIPMSDMKVLKH